MPRTIVHTRDSVEYVKATVTADVDLDMTVALAITAPGASAVWLPGTWLGTSVETVDPTTGNSTFVRSVRTTTEVTFSTANYPLSGYTVRVKLTDSPETPIVNAGSLTIIP